MTIDEFSKLDKKQQDEMLAKYGDVQKIAEEIVKKEMESGLPRMSMKDFEEKIKSIIENQIKSMTPVDKKFWAYPGIGTDAKTLDNVTPQGKFAKTKAFLNALVAGDVQILRQMHADTAKTRALSEGTTTAGGFLVPEEFLAEIQRLAPEYGIFRRECRVIPMRYDTLNIPAAGANDQSANWTNEASQILQTDPNFRQLTLVINKLASIPSVSNELLDDANVDTISYLAMIISEAFAKQEDTQGFTGSGSPFVGCLGATGVPQSTHIGGAAALSYQDINRATGVVYSNVLQNSKFYFHRSVVANIRGLITTAGAPIFAMNANNIGPYPLVSSEVLPNSGTATLTAYGVFGDLRRGVAMGERGSMTMAISEHATVGANNLFEKDMRALRVIERVAMGVLLPSAFVTIRG